MPRDGSGVYSAPAGTTATPNAVIESSKYNALVSDLVSDANAARPITAGGTGATNASDARLNLGVSSPAGFGTPVNLAIAASVAGNALTVSVKGVDGNDPSSTNPVYIPFRNVSGGTGTPVVRTLTAATSLTISSGSTLGFTSGSPGRLWIVAFDDGGTVRLGVINCLNGQVIYPLSQTYTASSTAEGGAGGADSALIFYTSSAVSGKSLTILGYMEWASGLATAGTWDAAPGVVKTIQVGDKTPGDQVGFASSITGAVSSATAVIPFDDTIPQSSEGVLLLSQGYTPTSSCNLLEIDYLVYLNASAGVLVTAALFGSAASAISAATQPIASADTVTDVAGAYVAKSGGSTLVSYTVRGGANTSGTLTVNGQGGARRFGGVLNSYIKIREIMA